MAVIKSVMWTLLTIYYTLTISATGSQLRSIICPNKCDCYKDQIFCDAANLNRVPTLIPTNTRILDLRQNNITRINNELWELPQLETLDLSYNNLSSVRSDAFVKNNYLRELQLENNHFTSISFNPQKWGISVTLRSLNVANNKLGPELIPALFQRFTSLQMLDLSGNEISNLSEDTFIGLVSLNHLVLKSNAFTSVPTAALGGDEGVLSNSLQILELSNNPIDIMNKDSFIATEGMNLMKLDVLLLNSMPTLYDIEDETFASLPSLRVVEITDCPLLHHIAGSAFKDLHQIEFIYLNDNHLQHIDEDLFNWESIENNGVRLYSNPWHCDCHMAWLFNDVIKTKLDKRNLIICAEPDEVQGSRLFSLDNKYGSIPCEKSSHGEDLNPNHLLHRSQNNPHPHPKHKVESWKEQYNEEMFPKVFAIVVPLFVCGSLFFLLLAGYLKRWQRQRRDSWLRAMKYGSLYKDNYAYRHSSLDVHQMSSPGDILIDSQTQSSSRGLVAKNKRIDTSKNHLEDVDHKSTTSRYDQKVMQNLPHLTNSDSSKSRKPNENYGYDQDFNSRDKRKYFRLPLENPFGGMLTQEDAIAPEDREDCDDDSRVLQKDRLCGYMGNDSDSELPCSSSEALMKNQS